MRAMKTWRLLMLCSTLLLWSRPAKAVPIMDWTFDTLPAGGSVSAPSPGLAQWGYTINNLSDTLWLVLETFNQDSFANGTGVATFDYPTVAPGATATGTLFDFLWDPFLPDGTQNTGFFYLTASFYDNDPVLGGMFSASAPDRQAPYTVTVDNGATVPEPGTLMLLGPGVFAAVAAARRRRAKNAQQI